MDYSLSAAARLLGVHKTTLSRAIKSGKLSARREARGVYSVDASELARVYGVTSAAAMPRGDARPPPAAPVTPVATEAELVASLRAQLTREREAVVVSEATVADLRARLDVAQEQVTRLLLTLPASVSVTSLSPSVAPRGGFLGRLLGRA